MENIPPIDPLWIARKLTALHNFELPELEDQVQREPRYKELLWFLQWVSCPKNYAGGLTRFAEDFISDNQAKIIPPSLYAVAIAERVTPDQAALIDRELWKDADSSYVPSYFNDSWGVIPNLSEDDKRWLLQEFANKLSPAKEIEEILDRARSDVPYYLRALCSHHHILFEGKGLRGYSKSVEENRDTYFKFGPPSYWPSLCADLLQWMDARAEKIMQSIAETRVKKEILKWVRRAREGGFPIWITGSCRFGKTETIRNLAESHPGRYRVVSTPDDQSVQSLCRAIATTLGIDVSKDTTLEMRAKIEEVIEQSRIMLIFDEAHFLYPVQINRTTRPRRLDFIRTTIIDRRLSAAFISTPQSYFEARRKFEKVTGYTQGQWDGRMLREQPVELPEEISEEEAMAVCRIHLPGSSEKHVKIVALAVMVVSGSSVYAQSHKVAAMARIIAGEKNLSKPGNDEIMEAIREVLPALPPKPAPALPSPHQSPTEPRHRKTAATEAPFPGRKQDPVVTPYDRAITPSISPTLELVT